MKCAFEHGRNCMALTQKTCEGCSFFKTKTEAENGRKRAKIRIASLSEDERAYIMGKYYGKKY